MICSINWTYRRKLLLCAAQVHIKSPMSGYNSSRKPAGVLRRSEPTTIDGRLVMQTRPVCFGQMSVSVDEPDPSKDYCFLAGGIWLRFW